MTSLDRDPSSRRRSCLEMKPSASSMARAFRTVFVERQVILEMVD
jgi:hypothetical protein